MMHLYINPLVPVTIENKFIVRHFKAQGIIMHFQQYQNKKNTPAKVWCKRQVQKKELNGHSNIKHMFLLSSRLFYHLPT